MVLALLSITTALASKNTTVSVHASFSGQATPPNSAHAWASNWSMRLNQQGALVPDTDWQAMAYPDWNQIGTFAGDGECTDRDGEERSSRAYIFQDQPATGTFIELFASACTVGTVSAGVDSLVFEGTGTITWTVTIDPADSGRPDAERIAASIGGQQLSGVVGEAAVYLPGFAHDAGSYTYTFEQQVSGATEVAIAVSLAKGSASFDVDGDKRITLSDYDQVVSQAIDLTGDGSHDDDDIALFDDLIYAGGSVPLFGDGNDDGVVDAADAPLFSLGVLGEPGYSWAFDEALDGEVDSSDEAAFSALVDDGPDADLNGDGLVDGVDLGLFLGAWGTDDPNADLNQDGTVDGVDLGLLLGAWT